MPFTFISHQHQDRVIIYHKCLLVVSYKCCSHNNCYAYVELISIYNIFVRVLAIHRCKNLQIISEEKIVPRVQLNCQF